MEGIKPEKEQQRFKGGEPAPSTSADIPGLLLHVQPWGAFSGQEAAGRQVTPEPLTLGGNDPRNAIIAM